MGLAFWAGVFGVLYVILQYFRGVEELGPLLAGKMLGLALLSFVSILVLSNVITALSSFSWPRTWISWFRRPSTGCASTSPKLVETTINSSWMVALMAVPLLTAYGVIYHGGWFFAPFADSGRMVPLLILPAVTGAALTLVLVNIFPPPAGPAISSPSSLWARGPVSSCSSG